MQATATKAQGTPSELADELFTFLAYLLKASMRDMFATLTELDVSISQLKLLHVLEGVDDELTLKELGERLALSLPAASRATDGLHQRGLVNREEDEQDRRMKRVSITPAGRELINRVDETRLAFLEQFADTLTETQRRRLMSALGPIVARDDVAPCRPQRSRA